MEFKLNIVKQKKWSRIIAYFTLAFCIMGLIAVTCIPLEDENRKLVREIFGVYPLSIGLILAFFSALMYRNEKVGEINFDNTSLTISQNKNNLRLEYSEIEAIIFNIYGQKYKETKMNYVFSKDPFPYFMGDENCIEIITNKKEKIKSPFYIGHKTKMKLLQEFINEISGKTLIGVIVNKI
jgi:hypothetical protein